MSDSAAMELPASLRTQMAGQAAKRGLSESAWLEEVVREKLDAEAQVAYLAGRRARGDGTAFEAVLAKVPAAEPVAGDER